MQVGGEAARDPKRGKGEEAKDTPCKRVGDPHAVGRLARGVDAASARRILHAVRITYEKDTAYIYLVDNPAPGSAARQEVVELDGGDLVLDLDAKGKLIGIEVLSARKVLPAEVIAQATARAARDVAKPS